MTEEENLKVQIFATDAEKISHIPELKEKDNLSEISMLKVVQSENLISLEVRFLLFKGLDSFHSLIELDLSCNRIMALSCMQNLNDLRYLDLSCNQITSLEGIGNLINIEKIVLSHNKISNLKGLQTGL